jgi:hypothetical protein
MYERVTAPPHIGSARETETLDFKYRQKRLEDGTTNLVDIAISVAAFANRRGGNLLYGASQGGDEPLAGFAPLTPADVNAAHEACDRAIQSRCDPAPRWSATTIPIDGGSLLAIHVEPHTSALVAARVPVDKAKGHGGDAYVFPLRVGTQTNYLAANQLPMHMDPKVRRTLLLLSRINRGEQVALVPRAQGRFFFDTLVAVEEDQNVLVLMGRRVPIDYIESIWFVPPRWHIALPDLAGTTAPP